MVIKDRVEGNIPLNDNDMLSVTISGHVIEATFRDVEDTPEGGYIERVDNEHYIVKNTGEIKEYNHAADRSDSTKSLYRTFANIRRLINANTTEPNNCKWVTITYADRSIKGIEGNQKLYKDFRAFNAKLQRRYPKAEYISVVEPQSDGTWHMHIIYIWEKQAPYIPQQEFQDLWGKGFCWLTKVDDNDNIGAYLSAYLGNAEKSEADEIGYKYSDDDVIEAEIQNKEGNKEKKKFVKGARLHFYPNGMNIVRYSRGIKKPKKSKMHVQNFKIITNGLEPVYDKSYKYEIIDTIGKNTKTMNVRQMQYNTKRRI